MIKIKKIIKISPYSIICQFDSDVKKKIEILPLLENHAHLNGINQLKNIDLFCEAAVGDMGEIFWKDIIISKSNLKWNYDISPEYVYYNGITVQ